MAEGPTFLSRVRAAAKAFNWSGNPGPYSSPAAYTDEGWIPFAWPTNFGQVGYDPIPGGWNATVYACIMLYAHTISQLPGEHKKLVKETNGTETITNSGLARVLNRPNDYQTRSDFMLNMVISMLGEGNAYALALRNDRFEVNELHQFQSRQCKAIIAEDGEIFFSLGGNPVLDYRLDEAFANGTRFIVPQRDVLHFMGPAPRNPLEGESPLVAAMGPVGANSGAVGHFWNFFRNMSRPSGVLSTDLVLTKEQVDELRLKWNEQTKGANIGGTPILTAGLKWAAMGINAADMQIAEAFKMSKKDIAMIFGVPLALVNDMEGSTWNNTENLIMAWLRQGLGWYVDNIELAYDKLCGLERSVEYTELDYAMLLRPDFKTRIAGLKEAVQGGIYAPDEARKIEGLPKVKNGAGEEPRVQQQQVPLSWGGFDFQPPKPAPAAAPAAANDDAAPPADDANAASFDEVLERSIREEVGA